MNKITAEAAAHNMATLQELLLATAPSQKAFDFACRIFAQIDAKGAEWMAENAVELQIISAYGGVDEDRAGVAPVADNRPYFMAKFQSVLAAR